MIKNQRIGIKRQKKFVIAVMVPSTSKQIKNCHSSSKWWISRNL